MSISVKYRKDLVELLPYDSIGCELGVFEGEFSLELLNSGKFWVLHLVDPFEGKVGSGDKDGNNHKFHDGDYLYNLNKANFGEEKKIQIHRKYSLDFLKEAWNDTFDFVYIDTTHTYYDTKQELEESFRATRNGGIIAGHDFNLEGAGVEKAVVEFCKNFEQEYNVIDGDGLHSFYIKLKK